MKRLFIGLSLAVLATAAMTGCDEDRVTYGGGEYVMFADTLYTLPVQDSETYFDIPVAATTAVDYDRTYAVEVVDKGSNAIEGLHYDLLSNTVVIKAGELTAPVKVRGHFDNFADTDSIGLQLHLICPDNNRWALYEKNSDAKIVLQKVCPFTLEAFTGYARVTSSFYEEFETTNPNKEFNLIKVEADPDEENTVILKDYMYPGYDVKIKFNTDDPLEPLVEMDPQVVSATADAFGGAVHGDGKLRIEQPASAASFFNVCQGYVFQYLTFYVEEVGTVGTFYNIIEWISEQEYLKLKKEVIN